ncbi:unnamed protein product [Nesidiocoris tenuis]|uniref:Uncharacterized protein n=1 Tax=Nesidiocoris tenuis TaxID=355587 RepID=A0A6H5GB84_9HEMI|nr:unnamed protein product [Nesidiocoris tenuis]
MRMDADFVAVAATRLATSATPGSHNLKMPIRIENRIRGAIGLEHAATFSTRVLRSRIWRSARRVASGAQRGLLSMASNAAVMIHGGPICLNKT